MTALVLFDFDGTLADTAPDLAAAGNMARERRGLPPLPAQRFRPMTSSGARGMLQVALDITPEHPDYIALRQQFLVDYEAISTQHTKLFPGITALLERILAQGWAWGIVTNKMHYLAVPIVEHLGLAKTCATLVGGDSAARAKPYPDPLLLAAEQAGFAVEHCLFIGDDLRDIEAAHAAGMPAIAAAYGYLGIGIDVDDWNAERRADTVEDLWPAIQSLVRGS